MGRRYSVLFGADSDAVGGASRPIRRRSYLVKTSDRCSEKNGSLASCPAISRARRTPAPPGCSSANLERLNARISVVEIATEQQEEGRASTEVSGVFPTRNHRCRCRGGFRATGHALVDVSVDDEPEISFLVVLSVVLGVSACRRIERAPLSRRVGTFDADEKVDWGDAETDSPAALARGCTGCLWPWLSVLGATLALRAVEREGR